MAETQTYSNHTRWYPLFHFVVMPLLVLNMLEHLVRIFTNSGTERWEQAFWTIFSLALILLGLAARLMVLNVQDRVIRLEERLRYLEVLEADQASKAAGLPLNQIIALRFASNDELGGLVERALSGEFAKTSDIKRAIKDWRADHLRA